MRSTYKKTPKKKNIALRIVIFCLGMLALYTAAGFFIIPYYFTTILPDELIRDTGLQLQTEKAHFNPYTLVFSAEGISLEDTGEKPIIFIDNLDIRLALIPLIRAEWVCKELMIGGAHVNVVRNKQNKYNFGKLLQKINQNSVDNILNFSKLPFYFSLNNIDIQQGSLYFNDLVTSQKHQIEDITLRIPTISNLSYAVPYYISPYFTAIINGTPMEMTSKGAENPKALTTTFSDLSLTRYLSYLPTHLLFTPEGGKLNGTVELDFGNLIQSTSAISKRGLSIAFDITTTELTLRGRKEPEKALFPAIQLQGNYQTINNTLTITAAHFREPTFITKLPTSNTLLTSYLKEKMLPQPSQSFPVIANIPKPNAFYLHLKDLSLSKGTAIFSSPAGEELWQDITLHANNLHADNNYPKKIPGQEETGHFSFVANRMSQDTQQEPTEIKIQGELRPYHRHGIPQCVNTMAQIHNLKDPGDILKPFGVMLENDSDFFFSADSLELGPINLLTDSAELGDITIDGGKTVLDTDRLPLFLQLLLPSRLSFIQLNSLAYSGELDVSFTQGATKRKLALPQFQIHAAENWPQAMTTRMAASFHSEENSTTDSAHIITEGTLGLFPFSLQSEIIFNSVDLDKEFPTTLFTKAPPQITGQLSGEGKLHLPAGNFRGNIEITEGNLSAHIPETTWRRLSLHNTDIKNILDSKKRVTNISKSELEGLHSSIILDAHTSPLVSARNVLSALKQPNTSLFSLHIKDSTLSIQDTRFLPHWETTATNIHGIVQSLHNTPETESELHLIGELGTGQIELRGTTNLATPEHDTGLVFTGTNLPLSLFKKYIQEKDLLTAEGEFSFTLNTLWLNGNMKSRGDLTLSNLQAKDRNSNVAVALAILAGSNNTFTLSQNFSASSKQPSTPLFQLLYQNLHKQLIQGAASPLLLANKEFHSLIDKSSIPFVPGEALPTREGQNLLKKYCRFLQIYPATELVFSAETDNNKDIQALLEKENKLDKEQRKTNSSNKNNITGPPLNGSSSIVSENNTASSEMLKELAQARLTFVQKEYEKQLNPHDLSRVSLHLSTLPTTQNSLEPTLSITIQPATPVSTKNIQQEP